MADCCVAAETVYVWRPDLLAELAFCSHHARLNIESGAFDEDYTIQYTEPGIEYFEDFYGKSFDELYDTDKEEIAE